MNDEVHCAKCGFAYAGRGCGICRENGGNFKCTPLICEREVEYFMDFGIEALENYLKEQANG